MTRGGGPSESASDGTAPRPNAGSSTYYDQPVLKEPVWIWSVPAYFYTGGAAAGAALIGAVAQLVDRTRYARLIDRCRLIAAAGTTVGTALLIHDLGRPARFLNMLRVFRPTSAMSMGSWTLAAASGASGAAAALPRLGASRLGDVAGLGAGALAPVLGTYTGVLLSDTAVPVWQHNHRLLPALFGASGLASAADALDLLPADEAAEPVTRRLGLAAKAGELALAAAVERRAGEHEEVGGALTGGPAGTLWRAARTSTGLSLLVSLLPLPRRLRRLLAAALGTLGAVSLRFAVFQAGRASARDPRASFVPQRAGRERREQTRSSTQGDSR